MMAQRLGLVFFTAVLLAAPLIARADIWNEPIDRADKRFTVLASYNGDAVLDNETGLVWERSPSTTIYDWTIAQGRCNHKQVGNRMGWRLPTLQELESLLDPSQSSPALPLGHPFINVQSDSYWSATCYHNGPPCSFAWIVFFSGAELDGGETVEPTHFWCVRGGQGVNPQ